MMRIMMLMMLIIVLIMTMYKQLSWKNCFRRQYVFHCSLKRLNYHIGGMQFCTIKNHFMTKSKVEVIDCGVL